MLDAATNRRQFIKDDITKVEVTLDSKKMDTNDRSFATGLYAASKNDALPFYQNFVSSLCGGGTGMEGRPPSITFEDWYDRFCLFVFNTSNNTTGLPMLDTSKGGNHNLLVKFTFSTASGDGKIYVCTIKETVIEVKESKAYKLIGE